MNLLGQVVVPGGEDVSMDLCNNAAAVIGTLAHREAVLRALYEVVMSSLARFTHNQNIVVRQAEASLTTNSVCWYCTAGQVLLLGR